MLDALSATEAGMLSDVQRMHVISHNLANAGTAGFKKDFAVVRAFADRLGEPVAAQLSTHTDYRAGALKYTGNPLDIGVEGRGFLAVATPLGEAYTRQGNLRLDAGGRLVTASGHTVLGYGGEIRLITPEPRIDAQGYVWEGALEVGRLRIVDVHDPQSLTPAGAGLYLAAGAVVESAASVRQGYTETANVVAMQEMIKMIETVRHFEASQRVIRGYDAMLDQAINVGGEVS